MSENISGEQSRDGSEEPVRVNLWVTADIKRRAVKEAILRDMSMSELFVFVIDNADEIIQHITS